MGTANGVVGQTDSITFDVVRAVTEADDCDVTELPPLYDTVDPDALETIARSDDARVEFRYCGYDVVVDGDDVTVETAEPAATTDKTVGSAEADVESVETDVGSAENDVESVEPEAVSDDRDPVEGE